MGKTLRFADLEINFKQINEFMPWMNEEFLQKEDRPLFETGYDMGSFLENIYYLNRLCIYFSNTIPLAIKSQKPEYRNIKNEENYLAYDSYIASHIAKYYIDLTRGINHSNWIACVLTGTRYFEHGARSNVHTVLQIFEADKVKGARKNILDVFPIDYGYYYKTDGKFKYIKNLQISSYFPVLMPFVPSSCFFSYCPTVKHARRRALQPEYIEKATNTKNYIMQCLDDIKFDFSMGKVDIEAFIAKMETYK